MEEAEQVMLMNTEQRAVELGEFFGMDPEPVYARLAKGFWENHALVAEDFNEAKTDVDDPDSLLHWYRTTEAYIWELTTYHLEEGFNYTGMCDGIVSHAKNAGKTSFLSLGDGIGDLVIRAAEEGMAATYHDLEGSRTAEFAQFRFNRRDDLTINTLFTDNFQPVLGSRKFDVIAALDFLEHVPNVEVWAEAIYKALKKGGLFIPQNAFACGDAENGNSIPMHLSVNNHWVEDWDPMMLDLGFTTTGNGWWSKP